MKESVPVRVYPRRSESVSIRDGGGGRSPTNTNHLADEIVRAMHEGSYERNEQDFMRLVVRRGMHVADVGAPLLPHARYRQRAFVLVPLREIAPSFRDPATRTSVEVLVAELADVDSVRRVSGRRWAVG